MVTALVLLGCLLLTDVCLGQTSFDTLLSDYARPDFIRSALDLRGSTNGSIAYDKHATSERPATMSLNLQAGYSSVRNTRQWQHTNSGSVDVFTSATEGQRSGFSNRMRYDGSSRYFVKPSRYYVAYNGALINFKAVALERDEFFISSANDVGVGFGRVELVDDVIHASRLMDMLDCAGVLQANVSEEHILMLADTIATMKNSRFFDGRLQRVREQAAVASLLSDWGYIADGDFFSYAVLTDAYRFERVFWTARSGSSTEFLIGRDFSYDVMDGWGSADDLRLTIRYEDHKIRNQYLSTALTVDNRLKYRKAREELTQDRYISEVDFGYNVVYSPTNRVVWRLLNSIITRVDIRESEISGTFASTSARGRVEGAVNYYFSPRLRLAGSSVFSASTSHFDTDSSSSSSSLVDFRFSVQLVYSYF